MEKTIAPTAIIASDMHLGRKGFETAHNTEVKERAIQNVAELIGDTSKEVLICFAGDIMHRPHWSTKKALKEGEGFNRKLGQHHAGPLSEVLKGRKVLVVEGNCDPYGIMQHNNQDPRRLLHTLFNDPSEEIEFSLEGIDTSIDDVYITHGHIPEDKGTLIRHALGFSTEKDLKELGRKLFETGEDASQYTASLLQKGDASSLFHYLVFKSLQTCERMEFPGVKHILPSKYLRNVGNKVIGQAIAEAMCAQEKQYSIGVFGHTHQPSVINHVVDAGNRSVAYTIANLGSTTGDLQVRPVGTCAVLSKNVQGTSVITPLYSYHPDCIDEAINMPKEDIEAYSSGLRGRV